MKFMAFCIAVLLAASGPARASTTDLVYKEYTYFDYEYVTLFDVECERIYTDAGAGEMDCRAIEHPSFRRRGVVMLGFSVEGLARRPFAGKSIRLEIGTNFVFPGTDSNYVEVSSRYGFYPTATVTFDAAQNPSEWLIRSYGEWEGGAYFDTVPFEIYEPGFETVKRYDFEGEYSDSRYATSLGKWTKRRHALCGLADPVTGHLVHDQYAECSVPPAPVPLPASLPLLAAAVGATALVRWRAARRGRLAG